MKFGGSTRWNCRNTQKMSKRKRRKWQYDLQSCSRYKKAYLMKKWIFSSKLISLFKRSQFFLLEYVACYRSRGIPF